MIIYTNSRLRFILITYVVKKIGQSLDMARRVNKFCNTYEQREKKKHTYMHHTHTSSQLWPDDDIQCIAYVIFIARERLSIRHSRLAGKNKKVHGSHTSFFSLHFSFGERKKKNRPSVFSGFIRTHSYKKSTQRTHTYWSHGCKKNDDEILFKIYVLSM